MHLACLCIYFRLFAALQVIFKMVILSCFMGYYVGE